jgi:hypothetical protein
VKAVRFFWRYLGCRRDLGVALIVCAIVVAAAELSIPWLLQRAIDTALGETHGASLDQLLLWMLGVVAVLYVTHAVLLPPGDSLARRGLVQSPSSFVYSGDGHIGDVPEASDPSALVFFHDYAGPDEVASELVAAGFRAAR